jgi:hypothetical protein
MRYATLDVSQVYVRVARKGCGRRGVGCDWVRLGCARRFAYEFSEVSLLTQPFHRFDAAVVHGAE